MKSIFKYLDESLFKNQEQIKRMVKSDEIEFVDLGLSVKWAKCNLGAEKETDSGHYYMWGSITPNDKDKCCWKNTPFNNGQNYFDNEYFSLIKNKACPRGILISRYDPITLELGNGYSMPSEKDFNELIDNTNNDWVYDFNSSGINGYLFTNKNNCNKYIFIPAAGFRNTNTIYENGNDGYLWSSVNKKTSNKCSINLCFGENSNVYLTSSLRCSAYPIRPVYTKI